MDEGNAYLAGIGSWSKLGQRGIPSVYTDITQFISWIEATSESEMVEYCKNWCLFCLTHSHALID